MDVDAITSTQLPVAEERKREVNWSELPSIPLEKIYSFLNRFDRVNMSLVCRRWSEGYGSPSAWRTFKFNAKIWKNRCLGLKFAQKYGSMFRHVEITYHLLLPCTHGKDVIDIWRRNFLLFLKLLTRNSQLISLKIRDLLLCFAHEDTSIRDNIRKAIASFLRSQHHLKSVEFHNCFTNFQEYVELLGDLTEDSRNSITHFGLRGLSICGPGKYDKDSTVEYSLLEFTCLPSLTTLEVDYSFIFENTFASQSPVMKILKKFTTRAKLSKLILYNAISTHEPTLQGYQGLTSTDWQCLKNLYPDLQVELNLNTDSPSHRQMELLIVPEMPITRLDYTCEKQPDMTLNSSYFQMEIDRSFAHLLQCKATDNLVTLCLKLKTPLHDISSFIPIFQACKKLKYLGLFLIYPTNGIELLMRSWLENRPKSLKNVLIQISGVKCNHDHTILKSLEYESLLKLRGLNVYVNIKQVALNLKRRQ